MKKLHISYLVIGLVMLFSYAPIISLVVFSFNSSRSLTIFEGFSLRWYAELFRDVQVNEAVTNTFVVAIIATAIATVIGTFASIAISRMRRVAKDALLSLNNLPIVNPEIVTAVALLLLFLSLGVTQGFITMILAHVAFLTPYVIVTIYPKLRTMDENIVEAALDLGASPWKTIWLVIVPNIKHVIFAAASIAFTLSFDDFVISYFTAGTVKNISIFLYTLRRIEPTINALSTLMITAIILVLFVGGTFKREKGVSENE
jgi:spermidine/putrescine transport system permease protein